MRMRRWPSTRSIVIAVAILLFVACSLLPIAVLVTNSLSGGLAGRVLSLDARQRDLLRNTAILGIGTAFLATAIGAPLGFALARISLGMKPFLRVALAVPMLLPPYIVALAWTYLVGSRGLVAAVVGHDFVADWAY